MIYTVKCLDCGLIFNNENQDNKCFYCYKKSNKTKDDFIKYFNTIDCPEKAYLLGHMFYFQDITTSTQLTLSFDNNNIHFFKIFKNFKGLDDLFICDYYTNNLIILKIKKDWIDSICSGFSKNTYPNTLAKNLKEFFYRGYFENFYINNQKLHWSSLFSINNAVKHYKNDTFFKDLPDRITPENNLDFLGKLYKNSL